jgi:hypothetical protein
VFDPAFVGSTMKINAIDFTIVGVAPQGFGGTMAIASPELWLPLGLFDTVVNDIFKNSGGGLADPVAGTVIVLGHNLLDPIHVAPGSPGHIAWAVLHDRSLIDLPWGGQVRTSYPVLPWIGVIALGYAAGPWFARGVDALRRRHRLVMLGASMLTLFVVARTINLYGDPLPWNAQETPLRTVMSFLNVTKYPPSMDFLLLTLGVGTLLLALFEALPSRATGWLTVFGSVPLFFYLLHLYLLHLLNVAAQAVTGDFSGTYYGVAQLWQFLAIAALVAVPCWFACRWFAAKKRASGAWWMRYL